LQILHKKGAYARIITGIFSFFFVSVTRTRISPGRLVDKTSNHATRDVLSSRAIVRKLERARSFRGDSGEDLQRIPTVRCKRDDVFNDMDT